MHKPNKKNKSTHITGKTLKQGAQQKNTDNEKKKKSRYTYSPKITDFLFLYISMNKILLQNV